MFIMEAEKLSVTDKRPSTWRKSTKCSKQSLAKWRTAGMSRCQSLSGMQMGEMTRKQAKAFPDALVFERVIFFQVGGKFSTKR